MELKGLLAVFRKNRILFLLGALGLILLLFVGRGARDAPKTASPTEACESYRTSLEAELSSLCADVRGVGRVRVFLTLDTTEIAVYEKNVSGDSETLATVGGDGVLLAYQMPRIAGVSVVCEGADDPTVRAELYALLRASLALRTREIHVAPLK